MKSLKLHLFIIGCILVGLSSYAWADVLNFGQTVTGTISSPGGSNTYTFDANANDVVVLTMVTTSGNLSPKIQVYAPNGGLVYQGWNGYCSGVVLESGTISLSAPGTYTVVISDCSGSNTGTYNLYAQRTNNPSGGVGLSLGQTQTGTITVPAQANTYTFSANASDVMDFTIVASGSMSPKIHVYAPNGGLVAENWNGYCSGSVLELDTVTLPSTGTYTVLVDDCSDTNAGGYTIYSQRTNNPSEAQSLPFSEVISGTISSVAQANTYTFNANANDVVDFTLVTTSGTMSPKIHVYAPNGGLVAQDWNGYCSGSVLELDSVTLPASGTYTVLVDDCLDTNTGTYDLYAQRTDNPTDGSYLPFGQTQTGTISSIAQANTYVFSANASDVVALTIVTSGSLSPKIHIYAPNGGIVYQGWNSYCSGSVLETGTVTLPSTGTYTVLVDDCSDTNTGNYTLYSQRTNNPSGATMLPLSQTQTGSIGSVAQSNSYVFAANAQDVFNFTIATAGISPKIHIYAPNGGIVYQGWNAYCSGSVLETGTVTLPSTGTYTLLVDDCTDELSGTYTIYGQRTNSPFGPSPFLWGGQTQGGSIVSAAQDNTYTFYGTASNVVDLTMTTTSGSLSPKIYLYAPNGGIVAQGWNAYCSGSTLNLNSITLPSTGIYTVEVGDCTDLLTGTYNISGQCIGTCPIMPAITWPSPAPITYPTPLSATQLDATFSVAGTPAYNPASGTVLAIGPQDLSVLFTPTDITDYSVAEDSVQLMVNSPYAASVSPTSLNFGNQGVNTTSKPKTATLTNTGTAALQINGITASADFAIFSTTCKATLAVHKTCKISVKFTPTQLGKIVGGVAINDNAPDSPQTVALSGTGVASVTLTPANAKYAKQKVGTTSKPKTFTLTNGQSETLTDIVIITTGDFAVSSTTCGTSLAAEQKCTIGVTFTPTQTGTRTGQLSVSDNASNSPQTANLTGTGD